MDLTTSQNVDKWGLELNSNSSAELTLLGGIHKTCKNGNLNFQSLCSLQS